MDALEQLLELPCLSLREEDLDRLANGLLAGVAVEPLGARVPACYEAVRALADDRVARGLDDGRELAQGILRPLALHEVTHRSEERRVGKESRSRWSPD